MENNLQEGWIQIPFTDLLDIQGGTQPPKNTFKYEPTKGYIRLLQIRDFGEKPIPTFIKERPQLKTCETDDILIARYGASIGRIVTGMTGAYNVALAKVIIPKVLNKNFIKYLLKSEIFQRPILSIQRSAQDGFNKDDLAEIEVPIPPLPEQERIVIKLDTALQKVASNKQRLEKTHHLLKQFRQSVLATAMSGKLTEEWRECNDKIDNAEVLLSKLHKARINKYKKECEAAIKNKTRKPQLPKGINEAFEYEILEPYEIPDTWSWTVLDKMSTVALGGTPSRKIDSYWNGNINWVSSGEVANNKIGNTVEKITAEGLANSNTKIYPKGTVLLAMIGEGKTRGQVSVLNIEATTNQNVAGLLLSNDFICSEYVWLFLLSRYESLRTDGLGGAQPALNAERVGQTFIAIPPLEEQQEIVRKVEKLFAFSDKLEARYAKAKTMIDKLPQSILAKAFRGELVPQDPNDEPASVLLERIKKEKEKMSVEKKKRKEKV